MLNPPVDVTVRPRILTNKSVCHPCMVNANGDNFVCGIAGLLSIVGNNLSAFSSSLFINMAVVSLRVQNIPLHIRLLQ